jgi:hypothetical protein
MEFFGWCTGGCQVTQALNHNKTFCFTTFVIDTLWIARRKKNKDRMQSPLGKKKRTLKIDACFIFAQDSL